MDYLKSFKNQNEYDSFIENNELIRPNVCLLTDDNKIIYNKALIQVGDIAYWNGYKIKTISAEAWEDSMGTPFGVVVIGEGFLPDGRARIIPLHQQYLKCKWGQYINTNIGLTDYNKVITTSNDASSTFGLNENGYLPSDIYKDNILSVPSYVDEKSYYNYRTPFIPSPYTNSGKINPMFMEASQDGNVLCDIDGEYNTEVLKSLNLEPVDFASNYKDGFTNLNYYLPSAGELSIMFARLKHINSIIEKFDGSLLYNDSTTYSMMSSTINNIVNYRCGWILELYTSQLSPYSLPVVEYYARSFAKL